MRLRVGTSGFAYKEWKGPFYPEDLPDAKMLSFYGGRFDTVEINNTFYRMPKASVLEGWTKEVPKGFAFVLKAPQWFSHWARIADPERREWAKAFFETIVPIRSRLGPLLVASAPYQKKDLAALDALFSVIPADVRVAVEFGSDTWLDDDVYAALRARGAALVAVDEPGKKSIPIVATGTWGYVRLRATDYTTRDLGKWASRIEATKWKEAWVFFKHEDAATGPRLAASLARVVGKRP